MSNLLTATELKKQGSIADLLHHLGYRPVPKRGREKMYISMLRDNDSEPSFSVNDELGVWYDHGTGKGGNIIDFGLAYWKDLGFNDVVKKIQEICSALPGEPKLIRPRKGIKIPYYIVEDVKSLGTHPAITDYLKSRGIFDVAKEYLKEVYYFLDDPAGVRKHYFAAGWQNEIYGWEVRNRYFKGCLGHKAITFIQGHPKKVAVFEGFINYLSWRIDNPEADHSIIVLNTLTMLQSGIGKAKLFSLIDVFFDRDKQGHLATQDFITALPYATDRSKIYAGYNDYNDMIKARLNIVVIDKGKPAGFFSSVQVPFER